jgi:hypothetical protein
LDHMFGGRGVIDRAVRREAPEPVRPGESLEPETVVAGLHRTREDLYKAVALLDGLALGDIHWSHPLFGDLDLYQYILFIGQHEARHAMQIADVGRAREAGATDATSVRS